MKDGLLFKILEVKYFPHYNFLDANIGYNPSYTWRSLMAGKEALKKGLIKRYRQWEVYHDLGDPWLPRLCYPYPFKYVPDLDNIKTVSDLFIEGSRRWDLNLIGQILS